MDVSCLHYITGFLDCALLRSPQRHKGLKKKIIKFDSGISIAFLSLCVLCELCVFVVKIVTHWFNPMVDSSVHPMHYQANFTNCLKLHQARLHRHADGPTRPCPTGCRRTGPGAPARGQFAWLLPPARNGCSFPDAFESADPRNIGIEEKRDISNAINCN